MKIRFGLAAVLAAVLGLAAGSAAANTVYQVNLSGQPGTNASVVGSITTDSTVGILHDANIVDWQLDLQTDLDVFSLNGTSNSAVRIDGTGVTATATALFFDFGAIDQTLLLFQSPSIGAGNLSHWLCMEDTQQACGSGGSKIDLHRPFFDRTFSIGSGVQEIASVAATPLPAALPLLVSAIGGLGVVGWRRKRSA